MSENKEEPQKKKNSNISIWLCAIGSVLFILALVIAYFSYLQSKFPLFSRGDYATLGDSFGILSSLFSGLAFAGLIVTIVMQNKTLKLQMEELKEARKESTRQSKAQEGQEKVMNAQFQSIQLQQFETTFFKLIDRHNFIIKNTKIKSSQATIGTKYIDGYEYVDSIFHIGVDYNIIDKDYNDNYKVFFSKYFYSFKQVMDLVSLEMKVLVDSTRLSFYMSLIKSGMSDSELRLMFFVIYLLRERPSSVDLLKSEGFLEGVLLFDFKSMRFSSLEGFLNSRIFILDMLDYYGCDVIKKDPHLLEWLENSIDHCENIVSGRLFNDLKIKIERLDCESELIERHAENNKFDSVAWERKKQGDKKFAEYDSISFDDLPLDINGCVKIINAINHERDKITNQSENHKKNLDLFENCLGRSKKVLKSYIDPV